MYFFFMSEAAIYAITPQYMTVTLFRGYNLPTPQRIIIVNRIVGSLSFIVDIVVYLVVKYIFSQILLESSKCLEFDFFVKIIILLFYGFAEVNIVQELGDYLNLQEFYLYKYSCYMLLTREESFFSQSILISILHFLSGEINSPTTFAGCVFA